MKFKIFKTTDFTTSEGVNGTFYTVTHKGRFLGISTLFHEVKVDNDHVVVTGDLEVKAERVKSDEGDSRVFLQLLPKFDLAVSFDSAT